MQCPLYWYKSASEIKTPLYIVLSGIKESNCIIIIILLLYYYYYYIIIILLLYRTVLDTLLSLQPQQSVAVGESTEDKVQYTQSVYDYSLIVVNRFLICLLMY